MPREVSAGAIIFQRRNAPLYLLLHYESGHWDFVKGNVEKGETEQETVKRETAEEAGISDLRFVSGFREKIEYFFRREGKIVHKDVFFLLAETRTERVRLSYEHIGYAWLPFEEALDRLTFKNAKEILMKAERFLEGRK